MSERLRVGIDGFNLAMPQGTGVATYGFALAETLRSMDIAVDGVFGLAAAFNPRLREMLFFEELGRGVGAPRDTWLGRARRQSDAVGTPRGRLIEQTDRVERRGFAQRLPAFDRLFSFRGLFDRAERYFELTWRFTEITLPDPPAIMHWTYPVPIRLKGARNVYTLHDLVPMKLPYTTLDRKRAYVRLLDRCVLTGDHICTVSESSRADIVALLDVDPARVTNTYQATPVSKATAATAEADAGDVLGTFGLAHRGYFLFYGAIEPKKNVRRIIEAYLSLRSPTPLVIVGARAWQADDELRLLQNDRTKSGLFGRQLARRVVQLDYLPRSLLMKIVRGAKAVVFPSLYEGFGLPVLEAMQLGTPVITSTLGSLPEVAGDAALLVDPYKVDQIVAALTAIDGDPALAADLAARGLVQAQRFTQAAYRDRLEAMYKQILETPAR